MHLSFVTTVPTGLGNSGDIDFPLCKAWVYVQQCGDISMVKALLKSRQVILKLVRPVSAWNQKPCCSTSLRERCWGQNMALKPCYAPVIQAPLLKLHRVKNKIFFVSFSFCFDPKRRPSVWLGWAMVLGSFQCRGVLLLLHTVGQDLLCLQHVWDGWAIFVLYFLSIFHF